MKNYLKFVFAVFGFTFATFASINVNAKVKSSEVGCTNTTDTCGYTGNGDPICGKYHD
jgi:hypothetical protein